MLARPPPPKKKAHDDGGWQPALACLEEALAWGGQPLSLLIKSKSYAHLTAAVRHPHSDTKSMDEREREREQRRLVLRSAPSSLVMMGMPGAHERPHRHQTPLAAAKPTAAAAAASRPPAAAAAAAAAASTEATATAPRVVRLWHGGAAHAVLLSKVLHSSSSCSCSDPVCPACI